MKTVLSLLLVLTAVASAQDSVSLRVVSSNLTSGSRQNYDGGEGWRILQGLKPDVILMQEFNFRSNTEEDFHVFMADIFGEPKFYYRESEATDNIPNGIISRYPILESGEWTDEGMPNRDFAWAKIDIPGERNLWAISVHLSAKKADVRQAQARALVNQMENIPVEDFIVLGGDFNLVLRKDPVLEILSAQVFENAAPKNSFASTTTNMTGKKNFDWILNDADLAQYQVPVKFSFHGEALTEGENQYSDGLVFDSSTFPCLERLPPIEFGDSRAPGMQHLAVVKDYLIQK